MGSGRIIKILRGSAAQGITHKDKQLTAYNSGRTKFPGRSTKWWEAFHRKLQPEWLAPQHNQNQGQHWVAFILTSKANNVLQGNEKLMLAGPI